MKKKDLMLIFHDPDNYFFPSLKRLVYPPYEHKEHGALYYIYRAMNSFKLPSSFFWGKWKKRVASVKKIIIFDYGYQTGMEKYIKKINPSCEVFLFCWNKISKVYNSCFNFSYKDYIYSSDIYDCEKYGLKFNHIFYPLMFHKEWDDNLKNKLYYLSSDKGRVNTLLRLRKTLLDSGLDCSIRIFSFATNIDPDFRDSFEKIRISYKIPYKQYLKEALSCGIFLDITQDGQSAFTLRIIESLVFSRKLITNNKLVVNAPFYNSNNILIIDANNLPDVETIKEFISKPFIPYAEQEILKYGFVHWINNFI